MHCVILDACFRRDGKPYGNRNYDWKDTAIPRDEIRWLEKDLAKSKKPVVVFAHQRLDVVNAHGVKNSPAVRKVLEASGRVLAVFQGHNHVNELKWIREIPYLTLAAAVEGAGVENGAHAIVDLHPDGVLKIQGFRQQADHRVKPRQSL